MSTTENEFFFLDHAFTDNKTQNRAHLGMPERLGTKVSIDDVERENKEISFQIWENSDFILLNETKLSL